MSEIGSQTSDFEREPVHPTGTANQNGRTAGVAIEGRRFRYGRPDQRSLRFLAVSGLTIRMIK